MSKQNGKHPDRATLLYGNSPCGPARARRGNSILRRIRTVLYVLFFIGVAVAIVLPMILQYREKSLYEPCLGNMHQLGMAAEMYSQDYDDHLPSISRWTAELYPYIKSSAVYRCPKDETEGRSSYGMNRKVDAAPLDRMNEPWDTVLFYEARVADSAPSGGPNAVDFDRHNGYANFTFADGHVHEYSAEHSQRALRWIPTYTRRAPRK